MNICAFNHLVDSFSTAYLIAPLHALGGFGSGKLRFLARQSIYELPSYMRPAAATGDTVGGQLIVPVVAVAYKIALVVAEKPDGIIPVPRLCVREQNIGVFCGLRCRIDPHPGLRLCLAVLFMKHLHDSLVGVDHLAREKLRLHCLIYRLPCITAASPSMPFRRSLYPVTR